MFGGSRYLLGFRLYGQKLADKVIEFGVSANYFVKVIRTDAFLFVLRYPVYHNSEELVLGDGDLFLASETALGIFSEKEYYLALVDSKVNGIVAVILDNRIFDIFDTAGREHLKGTRFRVHIMLRDGRKILEKVGGLIASLSALRKRGHPVLVAREKAGFEREIVHIGDLRRDITKRDICRLGKRGDGLEVIALGGKIRGVFFGDRSVDEAFQDDFSGRGDNFFRGILSPKRFDLFPEIIEIHF